MSLLFSQITFIRNITFIVIARSPVFVVKLYYLKLSSRACDRVFRCHYSVGKIWFDFYVRSVVFPTNPTFPELLYSHVSVQTEIGPLVVSCEAYTNYCRITSYSSYN